jgi:hypothetical protein
VAAFVLAVAMVPAGIHALSNAASHGMQNLVAPSKPLGTTQTVAATTSHPELAMTVASVTDTRVVGKGPKPPAGHRLVAVTFRLENRGDLRWTWDANTRLRVVDAAGATYDATSAYPTVQAGPVVSGSPKVRPHQTLSGSLVFELPAGVRVDSVRLDVGPGLPKTLRWTV